jgi:hypothetical protein
VKSAVADSKEGLPKLYYFKDDLDTVIVDQSVGKTKNLRVEFTSLSIPGDFTDWLLRCNKRREFVRSERTMVMRIFAVPEGELDVLLSKLREFGLTSVIE